MCHHLFNSLSTIRNIYRGNNHSSFNRNFIDLQPEEEKMDVREGFSLHRKKRQTSCSVLPQLWECQWRARAGSPRLVQPSQPGCSGRCFTCRGAHRAHPVGHRHSPFLTPAFHPQPFRESLGFPLLPPDSWSYSLCEPHLSLHWGPLLRYKNIQALCKNLWPCQPLLHKGHNPQSPKGWVQDQFKDGLIDTLLVARLQGRWQSRQDHQQKLLVRNYFFFSDQDMTRWLLFHTNVCQKGPKEHQEQSSW